MLPPTGTITFLFTDIEGSTRLWEAHPEPMRGALARHNALAAEAIRRHDGLLIKERGEGDSLFAVFPRATDALAATCALQQALGAEAWPLETPLRVRMALHTGEADLHEGDYFGSAVNRCARLRAIGHGGQVLLSAATHELVRDALPEGAGLKDMGLHRLRDLTRPERVFQLLHPDLADDFPPLKSLDALPHNLPVQVTSFVGRERDIAQSRRLLEGTRLLTLTGSGGCGKTRLALQVAAEALDQYPDGVWLVELAPLTDPALVPQAVASDLAVKEQPGKPLAETLVEALGPRRLLLVLDNCEHLVDACAHLAERLMAGCAAVRLLATSREPLRIAGETTYRIPSLSFPGPRLEAAPEALSQYEAVRLLIDRAVAVRPGFAVTNRNAPAVAQVCSRLGGIPLAIELAAARVRSMTVEQVASRLDSRFDLLTGGSRTAMPRQQTLQAALDWSYDLLTEREQRLLRRASVFAGGWTLGAAEAVCADEAAERREVLDLLTSLVDKSLVVFEEMEAGEGRYRLLETVREYGQRHLAESGEARGMRQRHLAHFLALAREAVRHLTGAEQGAWLGRLEREHDNLRAALEWSAHEPAAGEAGLDVCGALWRFWYLRGHVAEGRARIAAALEHAGAPRATMARARALNGAGVLAQNQSDYRAARALYEEALALLQAFGDRAAQASILNNLGIVARGQGECAAAGVLYTQALALYRELGNQAGEASSLTNLGLAAREQGEPARARSLLEQALTMDRALGHRAGQALSLLNLGQVAHEMGDAVEARALTAQALAIQHDLGNRREVAVCLEGLAALSVPAEPAHAARLWGAAAALREQLGAPRPLRERARHAADVAAAREALDDDAAFEQAWQGGSGLTDEEAVAAALEQDGVAR